MLGMLHNCWQRHGAMRPISQIFSRIQAPAARAGGRKWALAVLAGLLIFIFAAPAAAQSCFTTGDMETSTRSALESAARQYFQTAQQGAAALQSNAEFDLSGVIEANREIFAGQPSTRSVFLLDNSQPRGQRAEFFCGIYNSPERTAFIFNDLPAGKYAVIIQDVAGKAPGTVSWVLHQSGAQWKVAGLFAKPAQLAGHDANWYLAQARSYKSKAQTHNAWLYYLMGLQMIKPLGAMDTPQFEKIYEEAYQVVPRDLPANGQSTDLVANGRIYRLTELAPVAVGENLDLVVKYQTSDLSDTSKTVQDNLAVIKALITRFPELREAFAAVVARAVAPNGQDYGSLLAIKDVK
jgi:hypothetical protein